MRKPGPGDLDPREVRHGCGLEGRFHLLGDFAGRPADDPRQGEGDGGGPVAVLALLGNRQHDSGLRFGQTGGRERLTEGVTERGLDHVGRPQRYTVSENWYFELHIERADGYPLRTGGKLGTPRTAGRSSP